MNTGEADTGSMCASGRNPEQQAIDRNVEEILERAVQSLPSAYEPVFRLREMEDLSTTETAERLGLAGSYPKDTEPNARAR